jgi:DNA helicase IV
MQDLGLSANTKENMLKEAGSVLDGHVSFINSEIQAKNTLVDRIYQDINRGVYGTDHGKEAALISVKNARERIEEMKYLENSPYFTKCIASFQDSPEKRSMYFGMYTLPQLNIYSWVAPIATIRFEKPGNVAYNLPNGGVRKGQMDLKDNFQVEEKNIKYYSSESLAYENTLIYQEKFTSKSLEEFGLKNIVRQMEKYQDQIIRIPYQGSLLISGPAGSGKTTLVFHRIAYLCQSPETKAFFQQQDIAVFVQDEATVGYFKNLLPKLGINNVRVFTFATWALSTLDLKDFRTVEYEDSKEFLEGEYQYAKYRLLNGSEYKADNAHLNCFNLKNLNSFYKQYLDKANYDKFQSQLKAKLVDRFDLTIMLEAFFERETQKQRMKQHKYSFIVVDEVENYLGEQLKIMKKCVRETTNAIAYIGDLRQKTYLFTLSNWSDIGENFEESNRKIVIERSYRNTRQILEYLKKLEFDVEIPEDIRRGSEVKEIIELVFENRIEIIKKLISDNPERFIGVIGYSKKELDIYKQGLINYKNVKVLTIHEAQGVEFEIVVTIDLNTLLKPAENVSDDLKIEEAKIARDLVYVALTRAIEDLVLID